MRLSRQNVFLFSAGFFSSPSSVPCTKCSFYRATQKKTTQKGKFQAAVFLSGYSHSPSFFRVVFVSPTLEIEGRKREKGKCCNCFSPRTRYSFTLFSFRLCFSTFHFSLRRSAGRLGPLCNLPAADSLWAAKFRLFFDLPRRRELCDQNCIGLDDFTLALNTLSPVEYLRGKKCNVKYIFFSFFVDNKILRIVGGSPPMDALFWAFPSASDLQPAATIN